MNEIILKGKRVCRPYGGATVTEIEDAEIEIYPPTEEEKKNLNDEQKALLLVFIKKDKDGTPYLVFQGRTPSVYTPYSYILDNLVYVFPEQKKEKKEIDFEFLKYNESIITDRADEIESRYNKLVDIVKSLKKDVEELKNELDSQLK